MAVLLARGGQPRRGQEAPVGAPVVVRLGADARWFAASGASSATTSSIAGTRPSAPAFFNDGVKTHVPETHAEVLARQRVRSRHSSNGRSPIPPPSTTCAPITTTPRSPTARTACRRSCSSRATRSTDRWSFPLRPATTRSRSGSSCASMQLFPHFYELRHPKTHADLVHVAEQFETYSHDVRLEHGREPCAVAGAGVSRRRAVPRPRRLAGARR